MSPRRMRIPEEKVEKWRKLRRDGWEYAAIAKEHGVDRRVVANRIREYERREMMNVDQMARRELAVKKLEEHFQDLESAARGLCHLSVGPMPTGSLRPYRDDGSPRFPDLVPALIQELRQVFLIRWGYGFRHPPDVTEPVWRPQDPVPEPEESMARTEAENLITGLKEHFGGLSSLIDDWTQAVQHYRETWLKLEHDMVPEGFSISDVAKALEELLRLDMEGAIGSLSERQTKENSERNGSQEASARMYQSGDVRDKLTEMTACLRQLEWVSTQLQKILGPSQIRNELLKTRCRYCTIA